MASCRFRYGADTPATTRSSTATTTANERAMVPSYSAETPLAGQEPGSKRSTHQWLSTVYRPQFEGLELHHLYRSLDHLVRGKERLEEMLFARGRDLFSLEVDRGRATAHEPRRGESQWPLPGAGAPGSPPHLGEGPGER